jgi:hypothetical protein
MGLFSVLRIIPIVHRRMQFMKGFSKEMERVIARIDLIRVFVEFLGLSRMGLRFLYKIRLAPGMRDLLVILTLKGLMTCILGSPIFQFF